MYQLFESISCLDGELQNLEYHQTRVDNTLNTLYPQMGDTYVLNKLIRIPANLQGSYKCRFVYGPQHYRYDFEPYHLRTIKTLKLIRNDWIEYPFKYIDRTKLDALKYSQQVADDIIIVRNNLLTDSSFANIALHNGFEWHTPETPLLPGTRRHKLIDQKMIVPKKIRAEDLTNYHKISLINAMLELGAVEIPIQRVQP